MATAVIGAVAAAPPAAAQADDGVVRFVVLGDTGMGNSMQRDVAVAIRDVCADEGCDFVIGTGDNIYYSGVSSTTDSQWKSKFEEPYRDVDLTFYQTLGNHDADGNEQAQVEYTDKSDKWEMPGRWYQHQHGNVLFVGLDTNDASSSEQKAFLDDALASSDAAWKFAYGHHPYVSNGKHGNAGGSVKSLLEGHVCGDVDAWFAGHDHILMWAKPQDGCPGTELIVSGAGGAPRSIGDSGRNDAHFQKGATGGFLWVEIDGGRFTGRFYDENKEMLYERSFTKEVPLSGPAADDVRGEGSVEGVPPRGPVVINWTLDDDVGEKWVEVYLKTNVTVVAVDADIGNGTWVPLTARPWGSWAASAEVPNGTKVVLRATLDDGTAISTPPVPWPAPNATVETIKTFSTETDAADGGSTTDEDPGLRDMPAPGAPLALLVLAVVALRRRR